MGQVVRRLSAAEGRGLRARLEADSFEFRAEPHATWAAKGPGVSVVLYASGKLLVQGKGGDDFAATYLDAPEGAEEEGAVPLSAGDPRDAVTEPVVGSDETGKGDYFGPLVVAAFAATPDSALVLRTLGVRDSKDMGDREAMSLADQIEKAWPGSYEVVSVGPEKYNELYGKFGRNLNRLLAWGHATAIAGVVSRVPCRRAVVDQFASEALVRGAVKGKGVEIAIEQRPRAESHPAVAAASVLARARFLRDLRRLGDTAGVKLHKGAGAPVDEIARDILRTQGMAGLAKVAKLHFKTTVKIGGLPQ